MLNNKMAKYPSNNIIEMTIKWHTCTSYRIDNDN